MPGSSSRVASGAELRSTSDEALSGAIGLATLYGVLAPPTVTSALILLIVAAGTPAFARSLTDL